MTTIEKFGYLEQDYLNQDYLSGLRLGLHGLQFQVNINDEKINGLQFHATINYENSYGIQYQAVINFLKEHGHQFSVEIKDFQEICGIQHEALILDFLKIKAVQFKNNILNYLDVRGVQMLSEIKDYPKISAIQYQTMINDIIVFGLQFDVDINNEKSFGIQFQDLIGDFKKYLAIQFRTFIEDSLSFGSQFHSTINQQKINGLQFMVEANKEKEFGFQFLADINMQRHLAIEFLKNHYQTYYITGYLDDAYLSDPYLTGYVGPRIPMQFQADLTLPKTTAFQMKVYIADYPKTIGAQFQTHIADSLYEFGLQFNAICSGEKEHGTQFNTHIIDRLKTYGLQFLANLNKTRSFGVQFQTITQRVFAVQFLATIYNTKYLRILHNFKSRGLDNTNWISNTTMTGDFDINNVDTDLVEQVWRSENGVKTGVKLTCDVGAGQICYMDTLAILNHNISVAANIVMLMSNDPLFISGVKSITVRARKQNTYYIAPELPTAGYRYFRIEIDDPLNSNAYLEIGTILFGAADIIQGENFTDEVDFEMVDYSDTINTEGFTNVSNSRALKRKLTLNFESINYEKRNYQILRNVYETYRTTHKCLWIPTPDVLDQDKTDRLRMFAKLVNVPKERHNNKGENADYVSFTIDLDESL